MIATELIYFVIRKKILEQLKKIYFNKFQKIFQDFKLYQLMINCRQKKTKKSLSMIKKKKYFKLKSRSFLQDWNVERF